jgi:hypothetical protein
MKIIRQEEGYIKLELANGQVLIIDETDNEYLLKTEGSEQSNIELYISQDQFDMYTPILAIIAKDDDVEVLQPEPYVKDGKIMPYAPEVLFNQTSKEFWGAIRAEKQI